MPKTTGKKIDHLCVNIFPIAASELVTPRLWVTNKMKIAKVRFGIAFVAIVSLFNGISVAKAADLELGGYGAVSESSYERYSYSGASQSGRYRNLGEGYYRRTTISADGIRNYSSWRSGTLSFELWALPYYGATSGSVLMTTNAGTINGRSTKWNMYRTGNKMALDDYAFPELNLWEYSSGGWNYRDNITFSRDRWM